MAAASTKKWLRGSMGALASTSGPGQSRAKPLALVVGDVIAKAAAKRELGKEGSGHLLNPVVGSQGAEILHVGPEIVG